MKFSNSAILSLLVVGYASAMQNPFNLPAYSVESSYLPQTRPQNLIQYQLYQNLAQQEAPAEAKPASKLGKEYSMVMDLIAEIIHEEEVLAATAPPAQELNILPDASIAVLPIVKEEPVVD
jgi:hypothetical protein